MIKASDFLWSVKSQQIKKRDNFTCQYCGKRHDLNVHHIFYDNNYKYHDYPGYMLITLCKECHLAEHAAYDLIGHKYHELLISGMLSLDIYKKFKNKEYFNTY